MSQRIPRRHYTDDFKAQAVALSDSLGRAEAARQLDIPVKSLDNWVDAARAGRPLRSPQRKPVSEERGQVQKRGSGSAIVNKVVRFFRLPETESGMGSGMGSGLLITGDERMSTTS